MDFTSLPEKFKVGSDASPSHSELSFPSSPPSRVWGGPRGGRPFEDRVPEPAAGEGHASQVAPWSAASLCTSCSRDPLPHAWAGAEHAGQGGGGSVRESVSKHFWSASCVGRLDPGHAEGAASMA